MISEHILQIIYLNEPEFIFYRTQLNGFTYFYLIGIIPFVIYHLFTYC